MKSWIGTVTPMTPEKLDELRRIEEWRAAGGQASAHYWLNDEGEVTMGRRIEMAAPDNPYRLPEGRFADESLVGYAPASPTSGPGLLGADIDRIARHHHWLGREEATREKDAELREARAGLADAFDEGFVAGRVKRARGLAGDFYTRIVGLHFRLAAIEGGAKSRAYESLPELRGELDELMEFARNMREDETAAAAAADGVDRRVS